MAEKPSPTQFSAFNLLTAWEQPICGGLPIPFADSQTIYVACEHNYVFAFNSNAAEDRHLRWRYELSDTRLTAMEPLNDGVLVGSDEHLYALDGSSARVRWRYRLRALGPKSGAFLMPSVAQLKYVYPYIHLLNHSGLFTLDSTTGKERHFTSWWRDWDHLTADTNLIYVTDKYNGIVEALAPGASRPSWSFECKAAIKFAPALDDSFLYCGSHDGYLHVVDKRTGQPLASIQLDAPPAATPAAGAGDDLLFVVTDQGSVLSLDIARAAWRWKFETQERSLHSLLPFDASLFVARKDGVVFGLEAQTGQLIWQHDLDTQGRLGLCRSGDTLIVATQERIVGFRAPEFGSQPARARNYRSEPQTSAQPNDVEEELVSRVLFTPPVDLKLPELNLPQQVWSISLPAQIATAIVAGPTHLVVGCEERLLVSVNPEDGSLLWQRELESDLREIWPTAPHGLCVATEGSLYCLDAVTGTYQWRSRTDGVAQRGVDTGNGVVFHAANGAQLVCVNKATGETLWKRDAQESSGLLCRPCSDGVLVFVMGQHGARALRLESGEESWSATMVREGTSPLFYSNGRVFAGCADTRLYAFDAHSGELLWVFKTRDQICYRPVQVADNCVVIAGQDQFVYALNSADGTLLWRHAMENLPGGDPCVSGENVFVGTLKGLIYALNAQSGLLRWKHKVSGEELKAGPTIAGSYLYVANDAGSLICLRPPPHA